MTYTIILILVLLLGIIIGSIFSYSKKKKKEPKVVEQTGSGLGQFENKEINKKNILKLLKDNKKVTNNDIERSLNVSDATATRYLDELEKENKIKQVGETGRSVYYELIQ